MEGILKKIISCAGYNCTVSYAITDYVSEFSNAKSLGIQFEFNILSTSGGIFDLENFLASSFSLYFAVRKFIEVFTIYLGNKVDSSVLMEYFSDMDMITWFGETFDSIGNIWSPSFYSDEIQYCIYVAHETFCKATKQMFKKY